jgi:hypothetical protein
MTWGPFTSGIGDAERAARCRALAALASVFSGPGAADLVARLRDLETDPAAAGPAMAALDAMPARDRRRALACYAALHRPGVPHAR